MGHKTPGMTEGYAEYDPSYMSTVQAGISRYFDAIEKRVKHPIAGVFAHSSLTSRKKVVAINSKKKR